MGLRVAMVPHIPDEKLVEATSGIERVIAAYRRYLPDFGIALVGPDEPHDIVVSHAGAVERCDVAQLHGFYWTADYPMGGYEWAANKRIVESVRTAKEVIVPSEWVAETLRRDFRLNPHVIGHGIDWEEWAEHDEPNQGYVLWNKNRVSQVCDPTPVRELARRFMDVPFLTTFAPPAGRCGASGSRAGRR